MRSQLVDNVLRDKCFGQTDGSDWSEVRTHEDNGLNGDNEEAIISLSTNNRLNKSGDNMDSFDNHIGLNNLSLSDSLCNTFAANRYQSVIKHS